MLEALYSFETLIRPCQTISRGHDTDGQEVKRSLFSKDSRKSQLALSCFLAT